MIDNNYIIAEWIVYNKEYIDSFLKPSMNRDEVIDVVMQCTAANIPHITMEEVFAAEDDERVLLIIDFYFIKPTHKEYQ